MGADSASAAAKKQLHDMSRENLKTLNPTWVNEMITSKTQLREKMSLFWHGHFASRTINIYFQQLLLNDIRAHALGNFGDLLKALPCSTS